MKAWPIAMVCLTLGCNDPATPGDTVDVPSAESSQADGTSPTDAYCSPLDLGGPDAAPPLPEGPFLTSNVAWTLAAPADDPWFPSRDMAKVPCVAADLVVEESAGPEEQWLSVRTQNCGYATASQPLLEDVEACSALLVHIWYFKFLAPKETSGVGFEVVVTVGDDDIDSPLFRWSGDQLPPQSGLIYEVVQTPRALKAGEQVYYHVSNHGSNSWEFIQLRQLAPVEGLSP